jgi:redox-sensitive bicupin YhaK (pirin superfamily)
MFQVRRASERGHANHGWLNAYHTFSFADYYDPKHMHFRSLRVMNEDRVAPGQGFGTHPHRDMEIVTYVLEGALEHKDSMGNGDVLRPGEFQHMSAGSGVLHSEFNPSKTEATHLYQIWVLPADKDIEPSYSQRRFDVAGRQNQWQLVASPDGARDSLRIHQDAKIHLANLDAGKSLDYPLESGRHAWLQVLRGSLTVNGNELDTSDGLAVSDEVTLSLTTYAGAEVMLFDLN